MTKFILYIIIAVLVVFYLTTGCLAHYGWLHHAPKNAAKIYAGARDTKSGATYVKGKGTHKQYFHCSEAWIYSITDASLEQLWSGLRWIVPDGTRYHADFSRSPPVIA